jgi:hypothetical protein
MKHPPKSEAASHDPELNPTRFALKAWLEKTMITSEKERRGAKWAITEAGGIDPVRSGYFFEEITTRIECGAKCGAPELRVGFHNNCKYLLRIQISLPPLMAV